MTTHTHRRVGMTAVVALAALTAGCSLAGGDPEPTASGPSGSDGGGSVTVVTHDSFSVPDELIAQFEEETGYTARLDGLRTAKTWDGGPLIRLSIGLEDPADLIADLEQGFAGLRAAGG